MDVIGRVLRDAKRIFRSDHLALTGGEPTLHPQFVEVIDIAVDLGYTWHMVTNSVRLPKTLQRLQARPLRMDRLTSLTLSLDGADEATHDAIRAPGSYRAVMAAASLCTALRIPFVFNTTIHKLNVHQVEAVGLLAAELGAARLSYVMHCATGSPTDNDLFLSAREWRGVMDRIDRMASSLRLTVSVPEGYYREQPMHTCVPFAGGQLHVDVEGRLNLCCQHSDVPDGGEGKDIAGDLNHVSLAEAYERFLGMVHAFQVDKARALARGELKSDWDHFPCNYCMKAFGKPHWTDQGAAGPGARRERKFPPRGMRLPVLG